MTVDGEQFYKEITSVAFFYSSMAKMLRKIRPALELMNRSERSSLGSKKIGIVELIESFRTWKATKPIDKVYALLGMSSDASTAQELVPDYTISLQQLAQKLIKYIFPSASIVLNHAPTTSGEVTFEVDGLLLGELGNKSAGAGARVWSIDGRKSDLPHAVFNQRVAEEFGPDCRWMIPIVNEKRLRKGVVVLLRGAKRPSVLRFEETHYAVDMLATPEPTLQYPWFRSDEPKNDWSHVAEKLSAETSDMMRFKISWDAFRAPYPEEVSRFTPSPTDVRTQWEAFLETIKDAAEMGGEPQEAHDCHTISSLWLMYHADKEKLANGTSQYSITIHHAAYYGYVGTLKLLLDSGADVDAIQPGLEMTALHIAVSQGHINVVDELLYAGANVDMLDPNGNSALGTAIHQQHTEIVKLLLSYGASPNPVGSDARTYLMYPSIMGLIDIVNALLDAGANPNATDDIANIRCITPLHMAAEMGYIDITKALVDGGANVNAKTSEHTTPLLQSAMNGHVAVAKLLLERGADVNAQQTNGTTPWDIAIYKGQDEVAAVLQNAGGARNVIFEGESTRVVERKRRFLCF
jgi:ankyrin repeat protein